MDRVLAPAMAFTLLILFTSCSREHRYIAAVRHHLKNYDSIGFSENLDSAFRSFFFERKGEGVSKSAYITSLGKWDLPLHPDYEILDVQLKGDTVVVVVIEQNDFSKATIRNIKSLICSIRLTPALATILFR